MYFDNPAGTQVPASVVGAVARSFIETNANLGGAFRTSMLADDVVDRARAAMARFLGAPDPSEIIFGPSMTALTFHISRCFSTTLSQGDEIILSRMDHDANVAPWLAIAREFDLVVRWLPMDPETFQIRPESLDEVLTPRTRLVALTHASNLTGAVNDIKRIADKVHAAGALVFLDAVQYAPHRRMNVVELDCDFVVCSAYKFYGPHVGVLWAKKAVLERLTAYKVRPSKSELPWRFELGTPQIELLAALEPVVKHIEKIGHLGNSAIASEDSLTRAFEMIASWEESLAQRLLSGLAELPGIRIVGTADPSLMRFRVPTISFVHSRLHPRDIARRLAQSNVFVWSGFFYALELIKSLGIGEQDGVVRVGLAHYNTPDEVTKFLSVMSALEK